MNASSPNSAPRPDRDGLSVERRLQRLRPQPLELDAESIVAAAEHHALEQTRADASLSRPLASVPTTTSHRWSLAAVGLSGFAAGILLTYFAMSRATNSPVVSKPPALASESPHRPSSPNDYLAADAPIDAPSDAPSAPSLEVLATPSAPPRLASWQAWPEPNPTLSNSATILAVRGSQPRNELAGLSDSRSPLQRRATPILQPTRYRGMGIPAGATPNQLLEELLGPL